MKISIFGIIICGLWLSGCATSTRGTHERVQVNSEPPGASVISNLKSKKVVIFEDGTKSQYVGCAPTPCSINISRKSNPVLTIDKPGYQALNVKVVSTWATGSRSIGSGSIVAGIPPGSYAVAGKVDALKRVPIQGAMLSTGLLTFGVAPLVDIAAGSNRSLSPNPITIFLAPDTQQQPETSSP